jgi:hypothetical protein
VIQSIERNDAAARKKIRKRFCLWQSVFRLFENQIAQLGFRSHIPYRSKLVHFLDKMFIDM